MTDQYLEHLSNLGDLDPDNLADFLVMAAKLILLKSRSLLPEPEPTPLDEREEEEMTNLFRFLEETAPGLKISMAGFYYEGINPSIYDFSSNWRHTGKVSETAIESRRNSGLKTTYYVACGIPEPNNFTFSPPAESCYEG